MFCDKCGAQVGESQNFCPACGKPVRSLMAKPDGAAIASHVRLLGIFWLAFSAFRLLPGLVILAVSQSNMDFLPPDVPSFVPQLIRMVGLFFIAAAVLGGAIGWGLLTWQPWARIGAIVFAFLSLLEVPFGTALGIYTLWILLPEKSNQEFRSRAIAVPAG